MVQRKLKWWGCFGIWFRRGGPDLVHERVHVSVAVRLGLRPCAISVPGHCTARPQEDTGTGHGIARAYEDT
eukprot:2336856-Rhodomonas_salina.2